MLVDCSAKNPSASENCAKRRSKINPCEFVPKLIKFTCRNARFMCRRMWQGEGRPRHDKRGQITSESEKKVQECLRDLKMCFLLMSLKLTLV